MLNPFLQELQSLLSHDTSALFPDLAPVLPEQFLSWAIGIAALLDKPRLGSQTLATLLTRLPSQQRLLLLEEELEAVREMESDDLQMRVLTGLSPYLPTPLVQEALQIANGMTTVRLRVVAQTRLALQLPEPLKGTTIQHILATLRTLRHPIERTQILIEILPFLDQFAKRQAALQTLSAARKIRDAQISAECLLQLASLLSEPLKRKALMQAARAIQRVQDVQRRVELLIKLAVLSRPLRDEVLRQALEAMRVIQDGRIQTKLLTQLLPLFSPSLFPLVSALALTIQPAYSRAKLLIMLLPLFSEPQRSEFMPQVLEGVQAIRDLLVRTQMLAQIIPLLSEPLREETLQQGLKEAQTIAYPRLRAEAVIELLPLLSSSLRPRIVQQVLTDTQLIRDPYVRILVLERLIPLLPDFLLLNVLGIVRAIESPYWRTRLLAKLAPLLAEPVKNEIVQQLLTDVSMAGGVSGEADILTRLASLLPEPLKSEVAQQALLAIWQISNESEQAEVLQTFTSHLPTTWKDEVPLQASSHDLMKSVMLRTVGERIRWIINGVSEQDRNDLEGLLEEILRTIHLKLLGHDRWQPRQQEDVDPTWRLITPSVYRRQDEHLAMKVSTVARGYPREKRRTSWKEKRIVNVGFSSVAQPATPFERIMPLTCDTRCYFWLEIGTLVEGAIDEIPSVLPPLPAEVRLTVTLFPLTDGLGLTVGEDIGELWLQADRSVLVTRQPIQPPDLANADLLVRRLFFPLLTPKQPGVLSLLCNIYYERILIQSRLIRARVMRSPRPMDWALHSQIIYSLSSSIDPALLKRMVSHRLSLQFTNKADNTLAFCFFSSRGNELFKNDVARDGLKIQHLIEQARDALHFAAWGKAQTWNGEPDRYGSPSNVKQLSEDLTRFAICGYHIYDTIIGLGGIAGGGEQAEALAKLMREPGFIQIAVDHSPRYLPPVSLIYDYPLDSNARSFTLCPTFLEAFQHGSSLEDLACFKGACPAQDSLTTICPSGFWGYRHSLGLPLSVDYGADLSSEMIYDESLLGIAGVSTDVAFLQRDAHIQRMHALRSDLAWNYADTRDKLFSLLKTASPHLVYFYCHGGVTQQDIPFLQVGPIDERGITRDNLRAVKIRWNDSHPLIFINGCHTTALEPEKAMEFVSAFIERGAVGVIGTEITIFEPLACTFAEECLTRYFSGTTIGEAVRGVRLALLQTGNPLGLVYVPYVFPGLRLVKHAAIP